MNSKWGARYMRGSMLVEMMVALAIVVIVFTSAYGALVVSGRAIAMARQKGQATFLLEEGAEAIRFARDADWNTISILTPDTTYCLDFATPQFVFADVPPACDTYSGGFTRTVVYKNVCRQDPVVSSTDDHVVGTASGGACPAGSYMDEETKLATVSVSWGTRQESLEFYIANIFGEAP